MTDLGEAFEEAHDEKDVPSQLAHGEGAEDGEDPGQESPHTENQFAPKALRKDASWKLTDGVAVEKSRQDKTLVFLVPTEFSILEHIVHRYFIVGLSFGRESKANGNPRLGTFSLNKYFSYRGCTIIVDSFHIKLQRKNGMVRGTKPCLLILCFQEIASSSSCVPPWYLS